jgi:hypothetical protein
VGIITELPFTLIIPCIFLGAGYALWLYFREIQKGGLRKWMILLMFAFRFIVVTSLAFLLLSPLVRISEKVVEKPIIIFGIDNSGSVISSGDSSFLKGKWPAMVNELRDALTEKAEVKIYSFGDVVRDGFNGRFDEKRTDISGFFNEVKTRFTNRNVAALILASDGIYNQGTDPYYAAKEIPYPVFTVSMGDTALQKDAIIKKLFSNKTAFKGDRFPIEVLVELNKLTGLKSKIILKKGDTEIDAKEIRANTVQNTKRVSFWIDANQTGLNRYRIELVPMPGETNLDNNHAEWFVEVRETKQKAALVFNSPHPDLMAIYLALSTSSHFDVTQIPGTTSVANWNDYDLVILHQLPSVNSIRDIDPVMKSRASVLFILGAQTDVNAFNALKTGLLINSGKNNYVEVEPLVNPDFSLFSVPRQDQMILGEFPPLQAPFGSYQVNPLAETMVFQQIAGVSTKTPLIMFNRQNDRKVGIIAGENIWRWRMSSFIRKSSFDLFDQTMDKIAIYLAAREDKSFLRINVKSKFSENEPIGMEAEVYNKSYERIISPDINVTILDKEKKSYPFIFSKADSYYFLNAGHFPVGDYTYTATAKVGNEFYSKTGEFVVSEINTESLNLIADHQVLSRIALSHDAVMVPADSLPTLKQRILARDEVRSVSSELVKLTDLISVPHVFFLILLLLAVEWILRKREGK